MTVRQLIEELEFMNQDAEIRFASQPSWPFEYSIDSVVEVDIVNPRDDKSEKVIFLEEGRQLGYLPSEAKNELMW